MKSDLFPAKLASTLIFLAVSSVILLMAELGYHRKIIDSLQNEHIPVIEYCGIIVRLNESLGHSVFLYLATRDPRYRFTYRNDHYALEDSVEQLIRLSNSHLPVKEHLVLDRSKLSEFEASLLSSKSGDKKSKNFSEKYYRQLSEDYKAQVVNVAEGLNIHLNNYLESVQKRTLFWISVHSVNFIIQAFLWFFLIQRFRNNIRKRLDTEKELYASESRFKDIALTSGDWIWEVDQQGVYTYVTGNTYNLLGYENEELLGRSIFDFMEEEESKKFKEVFSSDISQASHFFEVEVTRYARDGRLVTLLTTGVPRWDYLGHLMGFRGIDKDISEKKRAVLEREQMQSKMFQTSKMASVGLLAAGVGHEINNPMTIISGNVDRLQHYVEIKEKDFSLYQACLSKMETAIERVTQIINGLRVYSRNKDSAFEIIDLNSSVKSGLSFMRELVLNEGITLDENLYPDFLPVMGDAGKIQQVIVNLLVNAKDAVEGRSIKRIAVSVLSHDGRATVRIEDSGHGIKPENLSLIFDQFYTTKPVGKGTGLGLPIVRGIVDSMNGTIDVESEVDRGTVFRITFPLVVKKTFHEIESSMAQRSEESAIPKDVLIVDDEDDIREVLSFMLKDFGFKIDQATNGKMALGMIDQKHYDLVITDFKMPEMDGPHLLAEIRKRSSFTGQVFLVSGVTNEDLGKLGFDGILDKPFTRESLYKKIVQP